MLCPPAARTKQGKGGGCALKPFRPLCYRGREKKTKEENKQSHNKLVESEVEMTLRATTPDAYTYCMYM